MKGKMVLEGLEIVEPVCENLKSSKKIPHIFYFPFYKNSDFGIEILREVCSCKM